MRGLGVSGLEFGGLGFRVYGVEFGVLGRGGLEFRVGVYLSIPVSMLISLLCCVTSPACGRLSK